MIPLIIGITLISFILLNCMPGDPAETIAGLDTSMETVERIRHDLGLDKPIHIQYLIFLGNIFRGNMGYSFRTRQPVAEELMRRIPYTAMLGAVALPFSAFFGILFGLIAVLKRESVFDRIITVIFIIGLSTPSFWSGLLFIIFFAVYLGWFPAGGYAGFPSIILPGITLAIPGAAVVSRMVRVSLLEVLGENYVRTAKAKGLSPFRVMVRHALRNALIPTVTVLGLQVGNLLGGTVVVEVVFGWPGMGQLIVTAIYGRDYMMAQGAIMLLAFGFTSINLIVDILYTYLDPRIKYD
jgi:peptide/nickel transport system permease protein